MARKQPPARPTSFHEPLWAAKSKSAWPLPPPAIPAGCDPEVAAKLIADHEDGEKNPAWIVWGTNLFAHPDSIVIPNHRDESVPGAGPLCKITFCKGQHPESTSPEHLAKRFAECVNAFQGVAFPGVLVHDLRALLGAIVKDCDYNYSATAGRLLAQLGKPVSQEEQP